MCRPTHWATPTAPHHQPLLVLWVVVVLLVVVHHLHSHSLAQQPQVRQDPSVRPQVPLTLPPAVRCPQAVAVVSLS